MIGLHSAKKNRNIFSLTKKKSRDLVFCFSVVDLCFGVADRSVGRGWPDSHSLSLLRQRKEAKKGDHAATALRVPNCARQKWGESETRYAQTSDSLFPISVPHNWQCQKWM